MNLATSQKMQNDRSLPIHHDNFNTFQSDISKLSGSWSSGMTSPLHGGGHRFESGRAHLFSVRVRGIPIITISRNPHDPIRPERIFSKTFAKVAGLLEKIRLRGPKISKNCETRYRTFKKRLRRLPDFWKKSGYAARKFPKIVRRDIGRSKKSSRKLTDFC